jgi:uncharacterized membrane protein YfcA
MDGYLRLLWLVPLGFLAGGYGTLIGAGGGFVLAPVLLLIYPGDAPETITSISLAVVFFNALSGTFAYARSGRIDFKSGLSFGIATVPGAIAGALATTAIGRERFNLVFGLVLIAVAVFLAINPGKNTATGVAQASVEPKRSLTLNATTLLAGAGLSTLFGFVSSFFGIGGGFLYVPALVYLLHFPVHIATATSLFVLSITSLTGSVTHIAAGMFHDGLRRAVALSVGAIIGAQVGAKLSRRLRGDWIIRSLAIALAAVGLRLVLAALGA